MLMKHFRDYFGLELYPLFTGVDGCDFTIGGRIGGDYQLP